MAFKRSGVRLPYAPLLKGQGRNGRHGQIAETHRHRTNGPRQTQQSRNPELSLFYCLYKFRRVSSNYCVRRNVFGDNGSGRYNRIFSNGNTRKYRSTSANPGVTADMHRFAYQKRMVVEIVIVGNNLGIYGNGATGHSFAEERSLNNMSIMSFMNIFV